MLEKAYIKQPKSITQIIKNPKASKTVYCSSILIKIYEYKINNDKNLS